MQRTLHEASLPLTSMPSRAGWATFTSGSTASSSAGLIAKGR